MVAEPLTWSSPIVLQTDVTFVITAVVLVALVATVAFVLYLSFGVQTPELEGEAGAEAQPDETEGDGSETGDDSRTETDWSAETSAPDGGTDTVEEG